MGKRFRNKMVKFFIYNMVNSNNCYVILIDFEVNLIVYMYVLFLNGDIRKISVKMMILNYFFLKINVFKYLVLIVCFIYVKFVGLLYYYF